MELKLKTIQHDYYEPLSLSPISCETMREHIVPDSCADIARIVETTGQVYVTGRELSSDGRVCASGRIAVSVLYIPEKGHGPCSLRFEIPFQCCGEGQGIEKSEFLDITACLQSIDARLLNPRKILARADIVLHPSVCKRVTRTLCTDSSVDMPVELLCRRKTTRVIAAVREKEFTFTEEIPISQGRGGAEEILCCRADIRRTDCKLIGTKLVTKGIVSAAILYRETNGAPELVRAEFPFSQILDGSAIQEEWEAESAYSLLNAECRIGGEISSDDRHVLTLTLLLRVRATVWREETMDFIADLYSTVRDVTCSTEELRLWEDWQRSSRRINAREAIETGTPVKAILDSEVGCGPVRVDGERGALEIPLWARCVYLDENDAMHSVRREFSTSCPTEYDPGKKIDARAVCWEDVMVNILPDGIEIRFPVECTVEAGSVNTYLCVSGGEVEEHQPIVSSPSLVLRKIGDDEDLWSVAKAYRTTREAILAINEISDEQQLPRDRLVIIPRGR